MICTQCGEPHFILPINFYPESERVHFKALELGEFEKSAEYESPQGGLASDSELALDMEDSVDEPLSIRRQSLQKLGRDEDSVDRPLRKPAPPSDEFDLPDDDESPERIALPSPKQERAGQRQKLLIVGTSFFILVGAMVVWALWDRGQETAEVDLQTARDAGIIALESGDFGEARRQFTIALEALDTLAVAGERRDSIQRLWQETDTILGLTNNGLLKVVASARNTLSEGTEEQWASEFRALYADSWIVIQQAPIQIASGGPEGRRRLELLYIDPEDSSALPIYIEGVDAVLSQAQSVEGTSGIVFAGQLAGCRRDVDAWVVELNPDTAFLWRRFRSLVQLGFVDDADFDTRRLVQTQASLTEASEVAVVPQENPDAT